MTPNDFLNAALITTAINFAVLTGFTAGILIALLFRKDK